MEDTVRMRSIQPRSGRVWKTFACSDACPPASATGPTFDRGNFSLKSAGRLSLLKMSVSTYSRLMPSYSATILTDAVRGLPAGVGGLRVCSPRQFALQRPVSPHHHGTQTH